MASVSDSLISAIDLAPTFLALAGVKPGASFQGKSFLPILKNPKARIRGVVFAEQNWHDYEAHARAARSVRFKYIRNAYPDLPLTPSADGVRSPTFPSLIKLRKDGALSQAQSVYFVQPRPGEELYDCATDPHEIHNLIADPKHSVVLTELRTALDRWEKDTRDYVPSLRTADEFDRTTGLPTPARVRPHLSKQEMVSKGLAAPTKKP